jgi:hypothetical protein
VNDRERDPYKFVMLAGFGLLSVNSLVRWNSASNGVLQAFPAPWGKVLLFGIVFNCAVSLYGIIRQQTVRGVLYERAGQLGLVGQALIYGTWGFIKFGERASGFAGLLVMLAVAATWRVAQLERRKRRQRRREGATDDGSP